MATAYINHVVPVPRISGIRPSHKTVEPEMTLGGVQRSDVAAVKRSWSLTSEKLTPTEYNAIVDYLYSISFTATWWWHSALGGAPETDSIKAYVRIESDDIVEFGRDGDWHEGHTITLSVIEQE